MKSLNKWLTISAFCIGALILLYVYVDSAGQANHLNNRGKFIVAKVTQIQYKRLSYDFNIKGEKFESSIKYHNPNIPPLKVGDKIIVKYYIKDPSLNRAVFLDSREPILSEYYQPLDILKDYEFTAGDIANSVP